MMEGSNGNGGRTAGKLEQFVEDHGKVHASQDKQVDALFTSADAVSKAVVELRLLNVQQAEMLKRLDERQASEEAARRECADGDPNGCKPRLVALERIEQKRTALKEFARTAAISIPTVAGGLGLLKAFGVI